MRLADSTVGEPLRALSLVWRPVFRLSSFHLPASLCSTVVTRFVATTDALTPARQMRGLFALRTHQHGRVSLIIAGRLPAIPSPTICVLSGTVPAATGLSCLFRLRLSLADSPTHADRIEFTVAACLDSLCYGLVVLVPWLSTPPRGDAVTVRYRTVLHRTEADFHGSVFPPSQAHEHTPPACDLRRRAANFVTPSPFINRWA